MFPKTLATVCRKDFFKKGENAYQKIFKTSIIERESHEALYDGLIDGLNRLLENGQLDGEKWNTYKDLFSYSFMPMARVMNELHDNADRIRQHALCQNAIAQKDLFAKHKLKGLSEQMSVINAHFKELYTDKNIDNNTPTI
jgi:hypothetical protein